MMEYTHWLKTSVDTIPSDPHSAVPLVWSSVRWTHFSRAEIRCVTNPLHLPKLFDCFVSTAVLLNDETLSVSFDAFGRIRGLLCLSVHSVGSVSCEIISKCQYLSSIGSYSRAATMLDRWDGGFGSWAVLFFSYVHYFDKGWLSSTKKLPPTMPPVFSFFFFNRCVCRGRPIFSVSDAHKQFASCESSEVMITKSCLGS